MGTPLSRRRGCAGALFRHVQAPFSTTTSPTYVFFSPTVLSPVRGFVSRLLGVKHLADVRDERGWSPIKQTSGRGWGRGASRSVRRKALAKPRLENATVRSSDTAVKSLQKPRRRRLWKKSVMVDRVGSGRAGGLG